MRIRKKKKLDGIDREILRVLFYRKPLPSRQIAHAVGLTPAAIIPRLNNLMENGIIKIFLISKIRVFERSFGNNIVKIKSPRNIFWDLDLKNE